MRGGLLLLILFLSTGLQAQRYSRIHISLDANHQISALAELGLDVEHGVYKPGKSFIGEFSSEEIAQIEKAGFSFKVLVADLQEYLKKRNSELVSSERTQLLCPNLSERRIIQTPKSYTYGSMGGYHTYNEMLAVLDSMGARYPHLFKLRQAIDSKLLTHEGRPIYWVKISDNPTVDEKNEPEALFTALHHSREPNSLSQLLFFMWYLLENYDKDAEVKYLVDNLELYFIPCVNPDGYIYNETTNPEGGGFWRKNRRNNNDGSHGVDLNRNYPFEWAYDDSGSSPSSSSETYRGPYSASEPETQLLQQFCESREFQLAMNYHSFGNVILHPWGYTDSLTSDRTVFSGFGEVMTKEIHYRSGLSARLLGYAANGTSDDWMYGDTTSKSRILAFTPEVGPGSLGFWPARKDIDGLNKDALHINMAAAHLLLNYAEIRHSEGPIITKKESEISFLLKKSGLSPGDLKVELKSLNGNVISLGKPEVIQLNLLEERAVSIPFVLDPFISNGDSLHFEIRLDNGLFIWTYPIAKIYSEFAVNSFVDSGDNLSKWSVFGAWNLTSEDYFSAPYAFTDSPGGNYKPNTLNELAIKNNIKLVRADAAFLSFWAKWDIEEDEDYAMALISVNGGSFIPLCGKYTQNGTYSQAQDQPVYDGTQLHWVKEEIDLSEYLGNDDSVEFKFAFRMKADELLEMDGFYFDDFTLTMVKKGGLTLSQVIEGNEFRLTSSPNPAQNFTVIDLNIDLNSCEDCKVRVVNSIGLIVREEPVTSGRSFRLDTRDWQNGIYFYQLISGSRRLAINKLVIAK